MDKLLEFPIQMSITGKTKSGKSQLLRKTILPKIIDEYETIFIFSPTAKLDKEWDKYILTLSDKNINEGKFFFNAFGVKEALPFKSIRQKVQLFPKFSSDQILDLIEEIGQNKLAGDNSKRLIVCDDCTDLYSNSKRDFFSQLSFKGRHSNLSYIFVTHKWNTLSTLTRSNLGTKIFYRITNERESNTFLDDNKPYRISRKDFLNSFKSCTGNYKAFVIQSGSNSDDYYCIKSDGTVDKVDIKRIDDDLIK